MTQIGYEFTKYTETNNDRKMLANHALQAWSTGQLPKKTKINLTLSRVQCEGNNISRTSDKRIVSFGSHINELIEFIIRCIDTTHGSSNASWKSIECNLQNKTKSRILGKRLPHVCDEWQSCNSVRKSAHITIEMISMQLNIFQA
jgi:hypothetical protein